MLSGGLCSDARAAEEVRAMQPNELTGIKVWEQTYFGWRQSGRTNVEFNWMLNIKNETPHELASVTVQMVAVYPGGEFATPPIKMSEFQNRCVPHQGSLLPFDKSYPTYGHIIIIPRSVWTNQTILKWTVTGAETYRRANLHDAGHLFTRLASCKYREANKILEKDPSLLKVRDPVSGLTAMMIVAGSCPANVIAYALKHGGSVHDKSRGGATLTHMAACNLWPDALPYVVSLLKNPNDSTKEGKKVPLEKAIIKGAPWNVKWLLAHGASPNHFNISSESLLGIAIREGQREAFSALANAKANPFLTDVEGNTSFHLAISNPIFLEPVSKMGISINIQNSKNGNTPLMMAIQNGADSTVRWLLSHGANPKIKNFKKADAFEIARQGNRNHSDKFLRDIMVQMHLPVPSPRNQKY